VAKKNMTKVKICGITNLEDALLSAKFGADALGFNFYEKSPRYIAPEKAREITEQLPPEILKVGVFVNESLERIAEIAAIAKLDALQLHGEETPEFARELKAKTNLEIIKAFRVSPNFQPEDVLNYETDAILLDAYSPKEHGGTGETFDWEIAKKVQEIFPKMYLAGGVSNENIRSAIHHVRPFAIDTCSRIEIEKGKKDKIKLINLILTSRNFDKVKIFFQTKTEKIKNIYDLLDAIQPCPALFIGKHSLSLLKAYLDGFRISSEILGENCDWKHFYPPVWKVSGFTSYVAKKFGQGVDAKDWSYLILESVNFDEQEAMNLFFALLEEFKLEKENLGGD
jgi:phosphoribosylanthranilate isomerase